MPGPYLCVLWAVWLALAVVAVAVWRNVARLWMVVAAAAAAWLLIAAGLGAVLGWTG